MAYNNRASNYINWINTQEFIRSVSDLISKRISRSITDVEKNFLISFIRNLNHRSLNGKSLATIGNTIADVVSEKIKTLCNNEEEIDTHELLKTQIGTNKEKNPRSFDEDSSIFIEKKNVDISGSINISNIFAESTPSGIQRYINPQARYRWNYFMLDSKYRTLDSAGTKSFSWNHVNDLFRSQGTVNTIGIIRDIIAIKVYPIRIPYTAGADNDLRRITALFDEFSSQAFIGHENRRFHTMFETTVIGDYIELNPRAQNDGIYRFAKPITQFDSLTLSFGSPLEIIEFDTDRMSSTITHAATTIVTTSAPHKLQSGNRVYISSYITTAPVLDVLLISSINTSHKITVTGANTFTIPINTTSVNIGLTGTVSVVAGTQNVIGFGTLFTTELRVGDSIRIVDTLLISRVFVVASITKNTLLTITSNYTGLTEGALASFHDNRVTGLSFTTYFDSKRFIVPIEIMYIKPID